MTRAITQSDLSALLEDANSQNMALAEPARAKLIAIGQDPAAISDPDIRSWLQNEIAIWSIEDPDSAPSV
jgi:hypothetical protein